MRGDVSGLLHHWGKGRLGGSYTAQQLVGLALVDDKGGGGEDGNAGEPHEDLGGTEDAVHGENGLELARALVRLGAERDEAHGVRVDEAKVGDGEGKEDDAPSEDGEAGGLALGAGLAGDGEQEAAGELDECDEQQDVGDVLEEGPDGADVRHYLLNGDDGRSG